MKWLIDYRLGFLLGIIFLASCKPTQKVSSLTLSPDNPDKYIKLGNFKFLEMDKLGFLYLVTTENEILKLDKDNNLLFRFSLRSLGDIHQLNVSNPQKILVYYAGYNNLIFLDNTLSEINRLDLEALGLWDIQGATVARDNFIWLLDAANLRLLKINEAGKIFRSTNEQDQELRHFISEPPRIYALENIIYLNNGRRISMYDEFGTHQKTINKENEGIQIVGTKILSLWKSVISVYDNALISMDNKTTILEHLGPGILDVHFQDNLLYSIDAYGLMISPL